MQCLYSILTKATFERLSFLHRNFWQMICSAIMAELYSSSDDDDLFLLMGLQLQLKKRKRRQTARRWWVHPLGCRWLDQGVYNNLFYELR